MASEDFKRHKKERKRMERIERGTQQAMFLTERQRAIENYLREQNETRIKQEFESKGFKPIRKGLK